MYYRTLQNTRCNRFMGENTKLSEALHELHSFILDKTHPEPDP